MSAEDKLLNQYLPLKWKLHFINWLNAQLSSGTRRAYISGWRNFLKYIGKDFESISKSDVDRYRYYLKNDAVSTRTKKSLSAPTINLGVFAYYRVAGGHCCPQAP
jgi:hypothetical protein